MRSPRLIYLAAAAVVLVAGLALTDWLTDRSVPDLGDGVVVPAGAPTAPPARSTPVPTAPATSRPPIPPRATSGAQPVTPGPAQTAGRDDDTDDDGVGNDLDDATDPDDDG